jgi:hypothetical protein
MKPSKLLLSVPVILLAVISFSNIGLTSCKKTTKADTVTVTKVDTLVQLDTVYCLKCGLVAYYNFNNGNLNDSSGNGNNITFNNATPTADRFGRPNNAYLFNGTSNYMSVPNSPSLNPNSITLFAIFKPNGFYSIQCHGNNILQKGTNDNENGWYGLRFNDTLNNCVNPVDTTQEYVTGAYGDHGIYVISNAKTPFPIHTGTWYVMAYTYDGTTSRFYANGVLVQSRVISDAFTPNTDDLFIGYSPENGGQYWLNGVIDEIRIYNQALCPGAIAQLSSQAN